MLETIFRYRWFILGSIKREFQLKYSQSLLGSVWAVLNPLAMIFVYTVIFSQVMRAKMPGVDSSFAYSIYLCAGVIAWGLFSEIILRSTTIFLDNGNLMKKINFPRICLPLIVIGSGILNFSIIFGLFCVFLAIIGYFPGVYFLGVLPILAIEIVFAAALGLLLGVINVFFRDVGQLLGVCIQFWFWFTPIVYPVTILPDELRGLLQLNPMFHLVQGYQTIFLHRAMPDWTGIICVGVLAVLICLLTLRLYRKHIGEVVDEL